MTGPKLNERSFVAGERSGTKASARYVRVSASKARQVLDLIRGLDVRRADEVLQFSERAVAREVRKVLASAVANAQHNDGQDAEELYVKACFADEGPTLRRFKPRARGRATRIRKRTCHITVIVARMSDERLAIIAQRDSRRASGPAGRRAAGGAAARRARVERQRAVERTGGGGADAETVDETVDETELTEVVEAPTEAADTEAADTEAADTEATETEATETGVMETEATETADAETDAVEADSDAGDDAGDDETESN
jgi:large subunit ribosomal protein L22